MRKTFIVALVVIMVVGGMLYSGQFTPVQASDHKILVFDTMVGIPQAFTGTQNPIRNINGGGLPWMLTSADGSLNASGKLDLDIEGLVLAAGPNAGTNPIANFRVIVSCLTNDGSVDNVVSGLFPATTGAAVDGGGNAKIKTTLTLPQPCIAPLIFVTSPGGAWFAVTGK
jgi:hypothetical protein